MAKKRKSKGLKWLITLIVLGAVAGGVAWYRKSNGDDQPQYQTQAVSRGDLTQTVTATGTLNPVTNIMVGCQISGRLKKIYVDFNSAVTNGELLAQIDPRVYQAQVQQAQADVASAKANLELQQVEAKRSRDLFKNHLISESAYDTTMANLHEAQATVKIKQAALNNAEANLAYTDIYSPVDGVVIARNVVEGQTVAASLSAPTLFRIASNLKRMQIDTDVDEADIGGIKKGQKVDFTVDAYPSRTFHGVVSQVRNNPTNSNNVVTYDTVIGVTNTDMKLKPGMTANVTIIVADHTNTLEIPNSALRFQPPAGTAANGPAGGQSAGRFNRGGRGFGGRQHRNGGGGAQPALRTVYKLAQDAAHPGGKLVPVQIKTGITDNINTEVLSGLKEGEEIVTGLKIPGLASDQGTRNPFARRHHHF